MPDTNDGVLYVNTTTRLPPRSNPLIWRTLEGSGSSTPPVIQFEPEIDRSLFHETLQVCQAPRARAVTKSTPVFYPMYPSGGQVEARGSGVDDWATVSARTDVDFPRTEPRARSAEQRGYWMQKAIEVQSAAEPRQFDATKCTTWGSFPCDRT